MRSFLRQHGLIPSVDDPDSFSYTYQRGDNLKWKRLRIHKAPPCGGTNPSVKRENHAFLHADRPRFFLVGLLIMKFCWVFFISCAGAFFITLGTLLIIESGKRYMRFRKAIAGLREKEAKLGYDIGTIKELCL